MPSIYLIAGLIAALTGVAHSFLGERLIFRHLRSGGLIPTLAAPPLRERHIRILWATWHLGSVFGPLPASCCASHSRLLRFYRSSPPRSSLPIWADRLWC